jgi:hypothetical protein
MRDLETAGRAVVEAAARVATPVAVIETRGHRRRVRRRVSGAAAFVTIVVVAVAGVAAGVGRRETSVAVVGGTNAETPVTDPQLRAHLGLDLPKDWVPVDYGAARVFVPPNWEINGGGTCTSSAVGCAGAIGPVNQGHGPPFPFVSVLAYADKHEPHPNRVVNGFELYRMNAENTDWYDVPELHVTIHVGGTGSAEVLATLAPSSERAALTYEGPEPSGFEQISYHGITMRVPASWAQVNNPMLCDDVVRESVAFGVYAGVHGCTEIRAPRRAPAIDGVVLSPPEFFTEHPASVKVITNGAARVSVAQSEDGRALRLAVIIGANRAVPLEIGLGRDGRVAAAIFRSIRVVAPTSTTEP